LLCKEVRVLFSLLDRLLPVKALDMSRVLDDCEPLVVAFDGDSGDAHTTAHNLRNPGSRQDPGPFDGDQSTSAATCSGKHPSSGAHAEASSGGKHASAELQTACQPRAHADASSGSESAGAELQAASRQPRAHTNTSSGGNCPSAKI